jgi:D-3-phosphoglycerate dehydrogenase / 2-oxoglutarate reductase
MARLVLCSPVDPDAVRQLEREHEVVLGWQASRTHLLDLVADADVLVVRSGVTIDAELLDRAPDLRLLVRAGSGTDNLALDELERRGIVLERVPGPGADAVAELTIAMMLSLLRRIPEADRSVRDGRWRKHQLTGHRAAGRTLGIVGTGTIGSRVGRLGMALGMRVLGCVDRLTPDARTRLTSQGIRPATFEQVLTAADVVTVHTPLTPATRHLLDADAIRRMRPGSYLLTLARGGVVDEHAVREALLTGHLAGAALDVHEHEGEGMRSPLANLPNVLLTPHIGAGTHEAQRAIGEAIVEVVRRATQTPEPELTEVAP